MHTYLKRENNKSIMNQILVTKLNKENKKNKENRKNKVNKINFKNKTFFKLQFVFSIISVSSLIFYYINNQKKSDDLEKISEILNKNIKLSQIYNVEKESIKTNNYLGKIIIDKINVEYLVFNNFNEELLKIAPCKFYGGKIGDIGNICIAGHNYNDTRFFSKLNKLNLKDEIKLIDLKKSKEFVYKIYDIFETNETDVGSVIKKKKQKELTLLTCNNSNGKRIIIKAFLKD